MLSVDTQNSLAPVPCFKGKVRSIASFYETVGDRGGAFLS